MGWDNTERHGRFVEAEAGRGCKKRRIFPGTIPQPIRLVVRVQDLEGISWEESQCPKRNMSPSIQRLRSLV